MKLSAAGITILAIAYVLILAAIIFIANRKGTRYLLSFIRFVPFGDKLGHLILMGILAAFVNWAMGFRLYKGLLAGSLIVAFLVTLEEISQIFIGGRSFDIGDLIADYLGIILFGRAAWFIFKRAGKSNPAKD